MTIIGYIHICQKGEWKRSLTMLMNIIKQSELYNNSSIIRLGIVNDSGILIEDEILNDPKFEIVYVGQSIEYERATLHHMSFMSHVDDESTKYYYLHTKGIRHFGTESELNVIDWMNLMLYWNIEKWSDAILSLNNGYDTYGINYCNSNHFSGNFWWATSRHIRKLPSHIGDRYNDPEDWVLSVPNNFFVAYQSPLTGMGHYYHRFPREVYVNI